MSSNFKSEFPLVPREKLKTMLKPENHKKFTKRYLANENLDSYINGKCGLTWMQSREGILKRLKKHYHENHDKIRAMMLAYAYDIAK